MLIVKLFHLLLQYSAEVIGLGGGGGEYQVVTGFGWSNGVIMHLFNTYGSYINKYPR